MSDHAETPAPDWYERAFEIDYLKVYKHRNDEEARRQISFTEKVLQIQAPLAVFDLGCGDGRHAVEWAKRGYQVTGLDLSGDLLARARDRAAEGKLDITFIQGDMREIPYAGMFDLLVNYFTSFGYFRDDVENKRVLQAIARALKPGGMFLMDYLNREHVIQSLVPEDTREIEGGDLKQNRWISGDPTVQGAHVRINKQVTMTQQGRSRVYEESVRMYTCDEMLSMIEGAGLKVTQTFGEFDGSEYGMTSPRLILVGEKQA